MQEVHDYLKSLCPDLHITRGEYDEDARYPETKTLTIGQFKLGLCHGHQVLFPASLNVTVHSYISWTLNNRILFLYLLLEFAKICVSFCLMLHAVHHCNVIIWGLLEHNSKFGILNSFYNWL
jgi:predicted phosphodiesterase